MRKKAEIKNERTAAAVERNPKAKAIKPRAPGIIPGNGGLPEPGPDQQLTGRSPRVKAATKPAPAAKPRAKRTKASEEPKFQIITNTDDGTGLRDVTDWMTKGELLAFLAEEISNEPLPTRQGKSVPFKMPENFGAIADLLYTTRKDRLDFQHRADALKVHETAMKDYLINNMSKKDTTGAAGHIARAQIETVTAPTVENWDNFYEYIRKTKSFDLLNRAPNAKAIKARWDAGKSIPGVGKFDQIKVSVTKVGG